MPAFKVADEVQLRIEAAAKIRAKRQKEPSAKQDLLVAPAAELVERATSQQHNIGEHAIGSTGLAQASTSAAAVPVPPNPVFSHSSKPKAAKSIPVQMQVLRMACLDDATLTLNAAIIAQSKFSKNFVVVTTSKSQARRLRYCSG